MSEGLDQGLAGAEAGASALGSAAPRVCLVTLEYPPDIGGAGHACARLVRFLVGEGFRVHVFAPAFAGARTVTATTQADGTTVHRVPLGRDPNPALSPALCQAIAETDGRVGFDVFHGFFLQMAYPCLAVAQPRGRPVIASMRGIDAVWLRERMSPPDLEVLRKAAWITSVSTDSLLSADALVDVSSRSSFLPNSVDASGCPAWTPAPENAGVVGTVCTFRAKKDIPALIQAYARTSAALRRRLLLVGDYKGPSGMQVRRLVDAVLDRYRLHDEVMMTGHVDHARVVDYLLSMRVFAVPSRHEGLPNAVLEAAAVGVPIVATRVDGLKDVLTDHDSALLVQPGDVLSLTSALTRVLADEGLARSLSAGARRVAARLTPDVEKEAWLDLYRRLVPC